VGDSRSAYTSTFHGFYAPLRAADAMIDRTATPDSVEVAPLLRMLGLTGAEEKNFVPVDWVSAVVVRVLLDAQTHGRTYHLTPAGRTSLFEMAGCMYRAVRRDRERAAQAGGSKPGNMSAGAFEAFFQEQMEVYESYWRNDPVFDRTNTESVTERLPCPEVDAVLMQRLCQYALRCRFGYRAEPRRPVSDSPAPDLGLPEPASAAGSEQPPAESSGAADVVHLGLEINGAGGGQWQVAWSQGRVAAVHAGMPYESAATAHLNRPTWECLRRGTVTLREALEGGRLLLSGPRAGSEQVRACLSQLVEETDAAGEAADEAVPARRSLAP
jgi:hypothetical protein